MTPVPIPFPLGVPLDLGLLGLIVVLFRTGLKCGLSGILGLTGVVYNLCGAGGVCDTSGLGDIFGFEVTRWNTLGAV